MSVKVEDKEQNQVTVIWCECGESIERVGNIHRATIGAAVKRNKKVENMTLADFRTKPFMNCKCFDK